MISVLFIDDNTDLLNQIRTILEKTGDLRVESAHSIKGATEKLKSRSFDVIITYEEITEVNGIEFVSDMNGIDFLKYLKSQGIITPVILYSRKGPTRLALQELSNGTELILPKSGDIRPALSDMVTLIKGTMLRKKAEREQKAQNEQLASILSSTPLGIFQMRNGVIEWVNRPFAGMLGYRETELVGREIRSIYHNAEEYELATRDLLTHRDATGQPFTECRLVRNDAATIPCRIQAQPLDPRDVTLGGTFIVTDISEKQKIADALKASEVRYREVLRNTQSIIIRMDLQGMITFVNTYALTFFDYAGEDLLGKNIIGTLLPEKARAQHDFSMMVSDMGFNAEGGAVNISENVRRNGDRVWIAWINKAIRDEKGRITEILCIGNDITDRKRGMGEVRISTDSWKDLVVNDSDVREEVFDAVFHICTEISIEGREGKQVGTTFLIGDTKQVMEKSRQIILNPFEGHPQELRVVTNSDLNENIKALAQLDGAFVITGDGFVEAVGRYITVDSSSVSLPPGMGTRHNSVAAITSITKTIGIVVSQSGGGITVFRNGRILKKITL
ncbi:MAG: PAS domain S-box protein [Methanoregula sp.]|jgi:PAS domain S-box-containing protein|nr:PAS domain S-box protein [Methanoregula sp.]